MNRAHSPQTLPLMLMMSAAVWAAHAMDPHSGAASQTAGAYAITFTVNAPSTVAAGATVVCKARIAPRLSALQSLNPAPAPVPSAQAVARLVGSSAACTVVVPFSFTPADNQTGAGLSYEIDALSGTELQAVRRQDDLPVAYPPSGGVASLHLDVNF